MQNHNGINHRQVIKWLILPVMLVTVGYSIVNVSEYASHYHNGQVVWLLGASVGTANAIAVYALVIAKTHRVMYAAVAGIVVFGLLSAILQTALYLTSGAPWLVALALGCFGPVAEALLSWLHAALSEEQTRTVKTKASTQTVTKQASTVNTDNVKQQKVTPLTPELTALIALGDTELSKKVGVTRQSVYKWRTGGVLVDKISERLPDLAPVHVNGNSKQAQL